MKKRNSLRSKLLALIISVIVIMGVINIYSIFVLHRVEYKFRSMVDGMITINSVDENINLSTFYFNKYFTTRAQSDLNNYRKYYNQAKVKAASLQGSLSEEDSKLLLDIQNTLDSFYEQGEEAVYKFLSSDKADDFYPLILSTKQVSNYSREYLERLRSGYLRDNYNNYEEIVYKSQWAVYLVAFLFIFITLACSVVTIVLSRRITTPIIELVNASEQVSSGIFKEFEVKHSGMGEIDKLVNNFNKMVKDINILINSIKEKARLEKRLKDQEMKNLRIENMLKASQLKVLQSQINPHFLFNTLNAIVQTSIIEGAQKTENLINSISDLLRYSLTMMERQSDIRKEIEIIEKYIHIQKTRFGDRLKFEIKVDEDLNSISVPGMTLQPLIENAFIHGIEPKEEGGFIKISVEKEEGACSINIEDDGVGIPEEKLKEILSFDDSMSHSGHITGIGVGNIISRLKLTYNKENVFSLWSKEGKGTKIKIMLPI